MDEQLMKSIDDLIAELYEEETVEKASSIDIAKDAKTTADAVVNQAPKAQKDEARDVGRPKQISDVPQVDMDGKRDSEYDAAIADKKKEEEPEEAKKQAQAMDQTMDKMRMKKSVEMTEEEAAEFEAFKKSKAEAKSEELKKAQKDEQESLVKAAVDAVTMDLRKSMESLAKANQEQAELIKAMSKQPVTPKSIVGIEQLEKSYDASMEGPKSFSKAEKLDAAERLVMKKSIPMEAVVELENTSTVFNPEWRQLIEQELLKPTK